MSPHLQWSVTIVIATWIGIFIIAVGVNGDHDRINQLRGEVACLQHPHAESSIAGKLVGTGKHRHFVITQPAHRTGC